jgi:hypothetical protein
MNCGVSGIIRSLNACGDLVRTKSQSFRCFYFFLFPFGRPRPLGSARSLRPIVSELACETLAPAAGPLPWLWQPRRESLCAQRGHHKALVTHSYFLVAEDLRGGVTASQLRSMSAAPVNCSVCGFRTAFTPEPGLTEVTL